MSVPELPTRAYLTKGAPAPSGSRRKPTHCSIGGDFAGSQFSVELAALLQRRLRMVSLIAFVPTLLFLIVNLLDGVQNVENGPVALALHGMVVVLTGWLAGVLWMPRQLSLCVLRKMELALFGSLGVFFGWLQFQIFTNTKLFEAAHCVADQSDVVQVIRLWIDSSAARWVFLVVAYGVFIPNTWRRCALITALMALTPVLITPLSAWFNDRLCPQAAYSLLDLAISMGTAMTVAVFGSHRLQILQQEAFQARQLGQYRLGKKLGAGGMGEVFKAEHVLLRRPCAIKLIRPEQDGDGSLSKRFEREVQAMATLTHPNTVEVFDYGQSPDGTFYYVMEYLPGQNLDVLVSRYGPMPAARAVHFLRQVCKALREAHAIGFLHRDVKPSNVIAAQRGGVYDVAKLLDFGLVQDMALNPESDRLTVKGTVLGSPPYLSPEQAAGRSDVDARADVYSLGGVGYFLLTGRPPFHRETPMEMLVAHAYEEPAPLRDLNPEVPADVEAVILRCLRKKPDDRFADVNEMEKALAACGVADEWTEEQAEQWWRSVPLEAETAAAIPTMTTPRVS